MQFLRKHRDMTPLARLKQGLHRAESTHAIAFKTSAELKHWVTHQLSHYRLGPSHFEPIDRQRETIAKLKSHRYLPTLKEARWLAFGLSLPLPDAPCLLEDPDWFELALQQISAWQNEPRRFRKCFQGLLHSYFGYDGNGLLPNAPRSEVGKANWRVLQNYLQNHLHQLKGPSENGLQPEWVDCLSNFPALLSNEPGLALADSEQKMPLTSAQVIKTLGIPRDSWFSKIWALAPLHQALSLPDEGFLERLPELIELLENHPELHDAALSAVLNRCGRIQTPSGQMPPHAGLREHCASHWGSPWLPTHQERWRHINPAALALLKDWFKLELIELFFRQLSDDREMRQRKTAFWQKHYKRIDSLHLALGPLAMNAKEPAWVQLRQKTLGFTVDMLDVNPHNNALVMAIGQHMAIELAGTSDDFCHYQFGDTASADPGVKTSQGFSSKALRESPQVAWLAHKDELGSEGQLTPWEIQFEALLSHL